MIKTYPTTEQSNREDKRLYSVPRDGRIVKRSWHQMSDAEHASQIEAEKRAAYVSMFNPCGLPQ